VGAELFHAGGRADGQTDGQTDRLDDANSRFLQLQTRLKNREDLLVASKEVGLKANAERTKLVICSGLVNRMQDRIVTQRQVMA
jgi:hypothetical protein